MSHSLLKHSDNPFKINGTTFAVEDHRTPIPNAGTMVSFSLLERDDDGGWNQLDKWDLGELRDATGRDLEGRDEYEDAAVEYLQEVAEDFYA